MGNDNFVGILKALKEKKALAEAEYKQFAKNIDSMIERAEKIIQSNGKIDHPPPSTATQNPNNKVRIEEIIEILRKAKNATHIDEICKIIGAKKDSVISRNVISMVISCYIRKFKQKAKIKKLQKFSYCIKK